MISKKTASMVALTGSLLFAERASAQDATPGVAADDVETAIDAVTIAEDVDGYYRGERISAFIVMGLGLAGIGTGIPLILQEGDFARGAGWASLIIGGLEVIGAIAYAIDVSGTWNHYAAALAEDPAAFREEETEHMNGTIDRFLIYTTTEIVLTLTGVGIAVGGFVADEDVFKGVGISMAALFLPIVIIDLINQARGRSYLERVSQLEVSSAALAPPAQSSEVQLDRLMDSAAVSGGFYLSLSRPF